MEIDESKKYVLTNYEPARKGGKVSDTDHATEIMDVNLDILVEKPDRREIFHFKDRESQQKFKISTSNTEEFTACFENNLPFKDQIENWRRVLNSHCSMNFKKIRIKRKNKTKPLKSSISKMINLRNSLIMKKENPSKIENLNKAISDIEAEENRQIIMDNFNSNSENPEKINLNQMWKTVRKIWPKCGTTLPTAKKNHRGKIISGPTELKRLLAKEYKERLRSRPVRPDLLEMQSQEKAIFEMKLKLAGSNKSPSWTLSDLDKALGDLKKGKSRDYEGYVNELFKTDVIGENLKKSLVILYNKLKKKQMMALFLNITNITTVPKKGSRLLLENERGIFRVLVMRYILMRLIYNSKYDEIDKNISDCQMGGRKGKSCRNNIFIINGIIYDVIKSKRTKPVLLQIYDYAQMFDSINLQKAINDVFDTGLIDDNLCLVYEANRR